MKIIYNVSVPILSLMKAHPISFIFALALLVFSCSTAQKPLSDLRFGANTHVRLLKTAEAAEAITTDPTDGFFEKITASEMSIQMKKPLAEGQTANTMRDSYVAFLKSDVEDFTPADTKYIAEVMAEVYKTCESVGKGIFPAELKLIKTTGRHYGDGVFYTRENCIVIPKNELENPDKAGFASTMFHELFHVYSRLNPPARKALYGLIGFQNIGFQNLVMPDALASRVFFNPDGTDFAQRISLKTEEGNTIEAIPIISSNHLGYTPKQSEFFGYLEFNLFQVVAEGKKWRVLTKDDGLTSTLDMKKLPDFFRQIKDNTHYIIHPDEVLADNFSFVMRAKHDQKVGEKFSPAGKQLLVDIENILKGGNPLTNEGRTPASHGSNR